MKGGGVKVLLLWFPACSKLGTEQLLALNSAS